MAYPETLADKPELMEPTTAFSIMHVFHHGNGAAIMVPSSAHIYGQWLDELERELPDAGIANMLIQFWLEQDPAVLADPQTVGIFAVMLSFAKDEPTGRLKHLNTNEFQMMDMKNNRSLATSRRYAKFPLFEISWQDIRADFDPAPYWPPKKSN